MKRPVFFPVFLMALVMGLTGCSSPQQVARQVQHRRQQAWVQLERQMDHDPNAAAEHTIIKGTLTEAQCLALAMEHNEDIAMARQDLMDAKGMVYQSAATAMPRATLDGSAMLHDDEASNLADDRYVLGAAVSQPLYLGGRARAALQAAGIYTYRAQQKLEQVIQDINHKLRKAFLHVLLAEELTRVAAQSVRDADEHFKDVNAKFDHGVATRFDVLRAQVNVTSARAEHIRQENLLTIAQTTLLNVMGVSQFSDVTFEGELTFAPVRIDERQAMAQAMTYRRELLIAEAEVQLNAANVIAQQSGNLPEFYLEGAWHQHRPGTMAAGTNDRQWMRSASVGIVGAWTVFDGLETAGKVASAKAAWHKSQLALLQAQQDVQLDLTQALLNADHQADYVQVQQGNVDNAAEALRLAQVSYRQGAGTSLEVLTAELAAARARSDYAAAVYDYQLALLNLHAAVGTLGDAPMPVRPEGWTVNDNEE